MGKVAFLSGITGQDGSFLSELLLKKGYEVHGIIRRASTPNDNRISHLKNLHLHYSDLSEGASLVDLLYGIAPDEIYSLGAQSHVRVSFDVPEYTADITGLGTLRLLEAIRKSGIKAKFYQAGSSEQFGSSLPPQNESTPFKPESPYAVAKIFSYHMVHVYRNAYGIFGSNGICFNHECISSIMPMIYKMEDGSIDIKPISEICKYDVGVMIDEEKQEYQSGEPLKDVEIWDKNNWTKIKFASAFPHRVEKENKKPRIINARNSVIMSTSNHVFFKDDNTEVQCGELKINDKIRNVDMPSSNNNIFMNNDVCFLLGAIVGDGYIRESGEIQYTSKNIEEINIIEKLWLSLDSENTTRRRLSTSGFTSQKNIYQLYLKGNTDIITQFELYNNDDTKRVPYQILNSTKENMISFLNGYNMADGLKSNKCVYNFRNFKTNSATLAQGLIYLISQTTKQKINITVEESNKWGYKTFYYSINLLSDSTYGRNSEKFKNNIDTVLDLLGKKESQRNIQRITGISRGTIRKLQNGCNLEHHPLQKCNNEIKKIIEYDDYDGWFYDLETESGTFHCGIGYGHVHNSERRGDNFVTRKITKAAARIKFGLQDKLYLGNIDAKRDWGYAGDYVQAMWMMLQHSEPDDFVIATGEMHSVREFLELSFDKVGLDPYKYVEFDDNLKRASEVPALQGDYSKINRVLGWKPETTFKGLVDLMMEHDMGLAAKEANILKNNDIL